MTPNTSKREYVSWADVMEMTTWLERGYGGRILYKCVVACPKGEQFHKLYWEVVWCNDALQERALPSRVLASYPSANRQSVAGLMLGLLYNLDAILPEVAVWAEPTIGRRPDVAGA